MTATLVDMGYRGEDVSRARAESRRQSLWPSSSTEPGATGSWNDGSRDYGQDDKYAPADGYGGYPRDDSNAGYEQYSQGTGYGQPADHRQQADYGGGDDGNGYRDGYGPGARYGEAPGYGQFDGYGPPQGNYPQGNGHTSGDGYPAGNGYGQGDGYLNDGYGYGDGNGYPPGNGYGRGDGYPPSDGYGRGDRDPAGNGYGQSQGHGGYGQQAQGGYEARGGYDADYRTGEYGQSGGYPAQPDGYGHSGGQRALPSGYDQSGGYPAQPDGYGHSGGQRALPSGYGQSGGQRALPDGYGQSGGQRALPDGYGHSGGQRALPSGYDQSGGYPAQPDGYGHSGDYPAQGTPPTDRSDVPGRYAGNDWYGGQPGAASGSGFADTGTYTMDARMIESYGTGPRPADYGTGGYAQSGHEPNGYEPNGYEPNGYEPNGYEPNGYEADGYHDGHQGSASGQLAVRGFPPSAAPLPALPEAAAPQGLVHTGQQERYEDQYESYPGYEDRDEFNDRQGYDDYDQPAGFGARGYAPVPGNDVPDNYDDYADGGDPYEDRYGTDGAPTRADAKRSKKGKTGGNAKTGRDSRDGTARKRGKRPLVLSALAVVAVVVLGAAAYVFVLKPKPSAGGSTATAGPLPTTGSSTSAATAQCVKQFGLFCHITLRTDDPKPLTLDELYPPQFQNETDHKSFIRAATRLDKTCANAVIGPDLVSELQSGKCTQVLRASYVSGDNTIMGTIGVVNLATTNAAHHAGKVVGANDFVAPLSSSKGIASKLGKGTGVVEAEYKGHYLILTWAEFTSTKAPTTKAQDQQLVQFENDLVAGTANISLSERMINGSPATAAG